MRRGFVAIAVALGVLGLVSTPTACYLSRGAWEEAKILSRRQPISELVRDPAVPPDAKDKFRVVLAARQYARDSLGLRTKDSFTTYSRLDHDTLVLLVSAAYRDTLKPYTWWFPIVGRVPYKGYFDFAAAKREAKSLSEDGFDVYVRPSDAFSTLGFFNDPLLNTTLKGDTLSLANTVIHELTHNTFYASGQAPFNESFAMFVGARGAAAFFRSRGQPAAAARLDAQWEDDKVLARFWSRVIKSLDSAYAEHPGDKEARIRVRDTVYARTRQALVSEIAPALKTINPRYAERVPLDNASLLARRVYASDLDVFDRIHEREGKDLKRTIGRIIGLAKRNPKNPFAALRDWAGVDKPPSPPLMRLYRTR
ncbi:MAG: aminopeptidase [Gemmatimonadota bacterium]|nr:aminopeptidase [Gemmatimonadota bacterium]MDQ6872580.1 aminopeptidase [Gemmatimonadota bacterium]